MFNIKEVLGKAKAPRHLGRLLRLRRRRARALISNTAGHNYHEKINSWVCFTFLHEYGDPPGPWGSRSSVKNNRKA